MVVFSAQVYVHQSYNITNLTSLPEGEARAGTVNAAMRTIHLGRIDTSISNNSFSLNHLPPDNLH